MRWNQFSYNQGKNRLSTYFSCYVNIYLCVYFSYYQKNKTVIHFYAWPFVSVYEFQYSIFWFPIREKIIAFVLKINYLCLLYTAFFEILSPEFCKVTPWGFSGNKYFCTKINIKPKTRQYSHKKWVENKRERDSVNENRIKFIITSKNFSKTLQSKEISFGIIALFVKLFIVKPRRFTIFLRWNDCTKAVSFGQSQSFIIFISSIHQEITIIFGIYRFNKFPSFRGIMKVVGR